MKINKSQIIKNWQNISIKNLSLFSNLPTLSPIPLFLGFCSFILYICSSYKMVCPFVCMFKTGCYCADSQKEQMGPTLLHLVVSRSYVAFGKMKKSLGRRKPQKVYPHSLIYPLLEYFVTFPYQSIV